MFVLAKYAFKFGCVLLIALNCSPSIKVKYDYEKHRDFNDFKTFSFMKIPENTQMRTFTLKTIKSNIIQELKKKGLLLSDQDPDIRIVIHTKVTEAMSIANWGYTYGPHNMYWRGPEYWGGKSIDTYYFEEGTLILDFIEVDTKELIWRGLAEGSLPEHPQTEKMEEIIKKAVKKILENFPPPSPN